MQRYNKNQSLPTCVCITDIDPYVCQLSQQYFQDFPEVEVLNLPFDHVEIWDAVVCPGNPFAYVSSGMDRAVETYFGDQIHATARDTIEDEYDGNMPLGETFLVETGSEEHRFVVYTSCFPKREASSYKCMKECLKEVVIYNRSCARGEGIDVLLIPAIGVYLGMCQDDVDISIQQMAKAFRSVRNKNVR
eukprot:TRINITY_DN12378_c0_g1_i1.p1 TRINITY_DN12378_c0_g1~~TRINITY_DN12378_c0_g1_i1.p1  ORF type:complete len:190 (+),score=33.54 TRINITY_DN12378_c0_g1_i1:48-617(+)